MRPVPFRLHPRPGRTMSTPSTSRTLPASPRGLLALVLAACVGLAAACSSTGEGREPDAVWVDGTIAAPSDRVVREMIVSAMERMRFPLGSGLDPVAQEVVSEWRTSLSPFKGEGTRTQAHVRYSAEEAGTYLVEVRVCRQLNQDIRKPSHPGYAEWKWTDDDAGSARVLLQHVRASFAPEITTEEPTDPLEHVHELGQP